MKRTTRYQVWVKTQRKFRNLQKRLTITTDHQVANKLLVKLDRLKRRLLEMNRKWRIGIATSVLLGWMAFKPHQVNAQLFPAKLNPSDLDGRVGFKMTGAEFNDQMGARTSSAGDINGDGIDDFMVSAIRAARVMPVDPLAALPISGNGQVYVVFGKREAFDATLELASLDGTDGFIIDSNTEELGQSIAHIGDINGDDRDDIVVSDRDKAYVIFGRETFSSPIDLATLDGADGFSVSIGTATFVRSSVASAGDINGDGIDDLVITQPSYNSNTGRCFILFGKNTAFSAGVDVTLLDGTDGFSVTGIDLGDELGAGGTFRGKTAIGAGDVNNDDIDDLVLSARSADGPVENGVGEAYVVFGKNTFEATVDLSALDGSNGFTVQGTNRNGDLGVGLGAADVNKDGFSDIIVGAPGVDVNDYGEGATYVVYGNESFDALIVTSTLDGSNGFVINGISTGDYSGIEVGSGDINGDQIDDIMIGAFRRDGVGGEDFGAGYVIFGQDDLTAASFDLTALDGNNGFVFEGANTFDYTCRVAGAGDINGDGVEDFIIGGESAGGDGRSGNNGEAYIVFGRKNEVPVVATALEDLSIDEGFNTNVVSLANTFSDADADVLTLSATSSDENVVTVALSGTNLTLTEVGLGASAITVTANDGRSGEVVETFTVTVSEPLGIEQSDFEQIKVYPNPVTNGQLNIQLGERISGQLQVLQADGKPIQGISLQGQSEVSVDLDQTPSGFYLIRIHADNNKGAMIRVLKD